MKTQTRPTLEQACSRFVHRYTMEHIPAWSRRPAPNGRHYAPQFRSDCEWYENTLFPGDFGYLGIAPDCYTWNQTWPLGQWLDKPFTRA